MALDKVIDSAAHKAEIKTIADAVRKKGGTTALFNSAAEMASAVEAIPERKPEQEKTAEAVTNGPVVLTADPGKAMSKTTVNVKVPSDKKPEQTYNRTYTQNGEYPIQPSPGQVISGGSIKVQTPVPKQEEAKAVEIKTNGTTVVTPTPGKVMNQVTIKTSTPVPKVEQAKTVQAVKNGPVTVTPDPGKVLSSATVNVAVPSDQKPETAPTEVIKTNGKQTFNPPAGGVFSSFTADVQVPIPKVPETQEKEITISENGDFPITPDVGKVLSKVLAHVNVSGGEVIQIGTHYAAVGSITLAAPATGEIKVEHAWLPRTGIDVGFGWIALVDWNSKRNASKHSADALHLAWYNTNSQSIDIYTSWYTSSGSKGDKKYGSNFDTYNTSGFYIEKDAYNRMIPGVEYTWIHCV